MQFCLDDSEFISVFQSAKRGGDGRWVLHLHASALLESAESKPALVFDDLRRSVSLGRQRIKMEPIPYRVLKLVWQRGKVSREDLSAEVWGEDGASDSALRNAVNTVNNKVLDAGFPLMLDRSRFGVSIELLR